MNYPPNYYPMPPPPPPHGQPYQNATIPPSQQQNTNLKTTQLDYGRKAAEAALPAPVHDPNVAYMEPPNPYFHPPAPHNAPQWPPPPMPMPHHPPPHMPPPPPYYHTHPATHPVYPPVPQPPVQAVTTSHAEEGNRLLISSNPLHAAARVQPPKPTNITTATLEDGKKKRIGTFTSEDGTEVTKVLCNYNGECTNPAREVRIKCAYDMFLWLVG